MPIYEYECTKCGVFECYKHVDNCAEPERCPECEAMAPRIISSLSIKIVQGNRRLPLGSGSPGKMITGKETGGLDIFIPSYGALEQEEVNYIAEGAIEKEKSRVRKKNKTPQRQNQTNLQAYVNLANRTPKGKKAKVLREAMKASKEN